MRKANVTKNQINTYILYFFTINCISRKNNIFTRIIYIFPNPINLKMLFSAGGISPALEKNIYTGTNVSTTERYFIASWCKKEFTGKSSKLPSSVHTFIEYNFQHPKLFSSFYSFSCWTKLFWSILHWADTDGRNKLYGCTGQILSLLCFESLNFFSQWLHITHLLALALKYVHSDSYYYRTKIWEQHNQYLKKSE